jgi:glutamate formiminotransferase
VSGADGGGAELECVLNVSEGRDETVLARLRRAGGAEVLDLHRDADHHRSVLTLGGETEVVEAAARAVTAAAAELLDLGPHRGAHPRFGVVDVVPFVPLGPPDDARERATAVEPPSMAGAVAARDRFARWAGEVLEVPCFVYGPLPDGSVRTLPEIRRSAFVGLAPDAGPSLPHPRLGAVAVGARRLLVAYNLWVAGVGVDRAKAVAAAIRSPDVRALGLALGHSLQVSCNLVRPERVGPAQLYDEVAARIAAEGGRVERAELVGLVPMSVLEATPEERWAQLDLGPASTIERRLEERSIRRR